LIDFLYLGGAGGSIYLWSEGWNGNGIISANGGNGANNGGGSGVCLIVSPHSFLNLIALLFLFKGRIAIYYNTGEFSGSPTAFGGLSTFNVGGPGTVFTKNFGLRLSFVFNFLIQYINIFLLQLPSSGQWQHRECLKRWSYYVFSLILSRHDSLDYRAKCSIF
jgi:hypothetical protein